MEVTVNHTGVNKVGEFSLSSVCVCELHSLGLGSLC